MDAAGNPSTSAFDFSTRLRAWFFLFRPWSYTATLIPFLLAAGLVFGFVGTGGEWIHWGHWALGLVAGIFFQSTVNLLNTWGDERSGVDNVPGAIRTTPQVHNGLVSMKAVLVAGLSCAALASLLGVGLCFYQESGTWHFNRVLLGAGFVGCLGSLNYSTGIKFKYRGLGVPFVSFLMGPLEIFVALALLMPHDVRTVVHPMIFACFLLWTLPNAALVGVIMHGNDMRDIPSDRAAGIVTLASWLGPCRALSYYRICHILPYGACLACFVLFQTASHCELGNLNGSSFAFLLPFLCLPLTIKTLRTATSVYRACPENPSWRGLERSSGGILFVFGFLYALVLPLVRLLATL